MAPFAGQRQEERMKRTHHEHDAERSLERYNEMRDFGQTAEPSGRPGRTSTGRSFVVQKHDARRLHYDFRLEHDGVLWSWAVPKGPSLSPGDRRLAVQTEDHPIDYRDFEGTIPEGQYGGGPVIVWDRGTWTPIGDPAEGMKKGRLDFELEGEKLHGRFILVRTNGPGKKPTWLLMKRRDTWSTTVPGQSIVDLEPESILTGRTIEDIRAGAPPVPPKRARTSAAKRKTPTKRRTAEAHAIPPFASVEPELATLVKGVPTSGDWIYEIKYDGYRALAWLDDGEVRIASRRGLDWTKKYTNIAAALARVRARSAIFDGEVAYVLEDGRTDFQKLQNTLGSNDPDEQARLVYFVFDLLFYDGVDLRDRPLEERKDLLRTILAGEGAPLKMSDHLKGGPAFFREACKAGLEGIIGKLADRPYTSGRTKDWIKVKCDRRQEMVIVGYTLPKGRRTGIGALLVGVREGKSLRYAGKVGTGFSNATLTDLSKRLTKLDTDEPAVTNPPRMREAHWVKPELVGQVRFSEWTTDGVLRHPSFEGLRLDKDPKDVRLEKAATTPRAPAPLRAKEESPASAHRRAVRAKEEARPRVDGIVISHPERVIDAETRLTKLDLATYAGEVAETMLPFVAKRPLMLLRCPGGTSSSVFRQSDKRSNVAKRRESEWGARGAEPLERERSGKKLTCFVQKHSGQGLNDVNLGSAMVGDEEVLYVTHAKQLVLLAQNNTVEVHGWGSTMPRWDRPDWIVFDLDPDEALPFERVVDGAFEVREALRTLGLESWVKTTGGKGLHVVVPIARRYDWATVRGASQAIATLLAREAPNRYVATMAKKARTGKIFIDYLRNGEGATAVLPYSARARPGLTVAMPVSWKNLRAVDPQEFTIVTVPKLLARRKTDPWEELLGTKQTLPRELLAAAVE
jgi:bifunctional non-homologous end joining protein LigD